MKHQPIVYGLYMTARTHESLLVIHRVWSLYMKPRKPLPESVDEETIARAPVVYGRFRTDGYGSAPTRAYDTYCFSVACTTAR